MEYTVNQIEYDTDGETIELPTELKITVSDEITDKDELIDVISDEISNKTGFCHLGFNVKELD